MSNLHQEREGLTKAWDTIAVGWRELRFWRPTASRERDARAYKERSAHPAARSRLLYRAFLPYSL